MFASKTNHRHILPTGIVSAIFFAMLCANSVARAQQLYGSVTGTVTDSSGAAVAGAQVTASAAQTGVSQRSH